MRSHISHIELSIRILCFQPIQIPGVMNRHEALQLSGLIRTLLPNNNKDLDP